MPFRYIPEIATADAAFEAWGDTLEETFTSAVDAMLNLMVEDLDSVMNVQEREMTLEDSSYDMLLFQLLQEVIYYKDAEQLLLRTGDIEIENTGEKLRCRITAKGEYIDRKRHELAVDVKAVTMHRLKVEEMKGIGWSATVVVDI